MHLCRLIYTYIDPLDSSIDEKGGKAIETRVKDVTLFRIFLHLIDVLILFLPFRQFQTSGFTGHVRISGRLVG